LALGNERESEPIPNRLRLISWCDFSSFLPVQDNVMEEIIDPTEVSKKSRVDSRRESYEPFFDSEWFKSLEEATKDFPALARIFLNLAFSWRGASNTHHLPSQTVHLLEVLANAHNPYGKDFKEGFTTRLMEKTRSSLSNMKRKEVQKAIEEICAEIGQEFAKDPFIMLDREAFWNDYVKNPEIRYTIIASQRMCYGSIYYAYEHFVLEVYRLVSRLPNYRMGRAEEFYEPFTAVFDNNLCHFCWSHPDIRIARFARNALAHNGGRLTDKLKRENHGFLIEDDEIQVLPGKTKELHELLKERVTRLVSEVAGKLSRGMMGNHPSESR